MVRRGRRCRAAGGVTAKERALRALQHLDAFQVVGRGVHALAARDVDFVVIDADRGVEGDRQVALALTAQSDRRRTGARVGQRHRQAGRQALHIAQRLHVGPGQLRRRDRRRAVTTTSSSCDAALGAAVDLA